MPNTKIGEKDFTVTNEGDATEYVVVIDGDNDDANGVTPISVKYATSGTTRKGVAYNQGDTTTLISNDFVYTLTCKSVNATTGVETGTCNGQSAETSFPMNGGIVVGNNIDEGIRHEYVLTVTYLETNEDQTDDMNKTFDARVNIIDIKGLNPYSDNTDSLAYNIINNSETAKNGTQLVSTPPSKVGVEPATKNWNNSPGVKVKLSDLWNGYFTDSDNYLSDNGDGTFDGPIVWGNTPEEAIANANDSNYLVANCNEMLWKYAYHRAVKGPNKIIA